MDGKEIRIFLIKHNISKKDLLQLATTVIGITLLGIGILFTFSGDIKVGFPFMFAGILTTVIPISTIQYLQYSEINKLENEFPKFLRDLAESKKSGMTFPQALISRTDTSYGKLDKHLLRAKNQLSWGVPFEKVMKNLGHNLKKSKLISRSFMIILEAFDAGGNVTEIMDDLSTDIRTLKELDEDRKNALQEQIWMMYIITIIFIVILTMLHKLLIPMISGGGLADAFGGGVEPVEYCSGPTSFICSVCNVFGWGIISCDKTEEIKIVEKELRAKRLTLEEGENEIDKLHKEEKECISDTENIKNEDLSNACYFKALFMYMAIIQGLFSGIIAGEIGDDSLASGAKHAIILVTLIIVVFIVT